MRAARAAWRLLLMLVHLLHGTAVVVSRFPSLDVGGRQVRVQRWSAKLLRRLGITLTVQGTPRAGPTLLVANHVSWLDAQRTAHADRRALAAHLRERIGAALIQAGD